jgi:hypothetical protein
MYLTRNQAYGFPYRGFESHPLRQDHQENPVSSNAYGVFVFSAHHRAKFTAARRFLAPLERRRAFAAFH